MGQQFEELPLWEFTTDEISSGVYRVVAVRDGGITGEVQTTDPDSAMDELKTWAHSVEQDLVNDKEYKAIVWIGESPGERVVVRAKDADVAWQKLRTRFGKEATISTWHEEDASSER